MTDIVQVAVIAGVLSLLGVLAGIAAQLRGKRSEDRQTQVTQEIALADGARAAMATFNVGLQSDNAALRIENRELREENGQLRETVKRIGSRQSDQDL